MAPPYGDIMKVETSGASWRTAKADGGNDEGVLASHIMAEHDRAAMDKYKRLIMKVAKRNEVDPAVICGIISRESRAGTGLDKHGRGDNGKAFGLMQIDTTPAPSGGGHTPKGEWNSEEHLQQGTEILIEFIKIIQEKFNSWTKEQQLKGGIAAYNKGHDRVESYEEVDTHTTGVDYSNDVVARAQWFYNHGYRETSSAVALAPIVLTGIGFGAGGIAAGSTAAGMMSAAAIANGGGVAAGSLVAILQSAGAVGLSGMVTAVVGSAGAAIGGAVGGAVGWLKTKIS
ncbi:lysozyme g isoform X4 [Oncorhynchus tshawytscha]|uniref:Lysozyme g n=1 Tax=Oncorhynchus tshawytscha TaxID=74940 RepID=A0A8C8C5K3_ONCTS|nr:lysozyme g isoform X4 [Oncorhynchus tshawytscha]